MANTMIDTGGEWRLSNVTIYQNGMVAMTKNISQGAGSDEKCCDPETPGADEKHLSLMLKKAHLSEAMGSLSIIPPESAQILVATTASKPEYTNHDSLKKLIGAKIEYDGTEYTVVSIQVNQNPHHNKNSHLMVIMDAEYNVSVVDYEAMKFRIIDPVVRKVIADDIAVAKYNSNAFSTIDLTIKVKDPSVHSYLIYTIPSPSYKFVYTLHRTEGKVALIGQAYVVNASGEDWNDITVDIDTKNATVFNTDLLEMDLPIRKHINLANREATAAIEVQTQKRMHRRVGAVPTMMATGYANSSSVGVDGMEEDAPLDVLGEDLKDSGNFSFIAKNVSIEDGNGAVVHLYEMDVAADIVTYAELGRHDKITPYNIISFKNEEPHDLFRGLANVYFDGRVSGMAIMPHTKSGNNCILTYEVSNALVVSAHEFNRGSESKTIGKQKTKKSEEDEDAYSYYIMSTEFEEDVYMIQNTSSESITAMFDVEVPIDRTVKISSESEIVDNEIMIDNKNRFKIVVEPTSRTTATVRYTFNHKRHIHKGGSKSEIIGILASSRGEDLVLEKIYKELLTTQKELDRLILQQQESDNQFKQIKDMVETSKMLDDPGSAKIKTDLMNSLSSAYNKWQQRLAQREELEVKLRKLNNEFESELSKLVEEDVQLISI